MRERSIHQVKDLNAQVLPEHNGPFRFQFDAERAARVARSATSEQLRVAVIEFSRISEEEESLECSPHASAFRSAERRSVDAKHERHRRNWAVVLGSADHRGPSMT